MPYNLNPYHYNKLNNDEDDYMYPSELYYTQDSIACRFTNGKLLSETFNEIIAGNLNPNEDIPPITVVYDYPSYPERPFVLGCRRLYIYQELEKLDVIRKVKVEISSLASQQHRLNNFTTTNGGVSVELRSNAGQFNKNRARGWNFYKNRYHFGDWEKSADRYNQPRSQHNNQPETNSHGFDQSTQDFTTIDVEPEFTTRNTNNRHYKFPVDDESCCPCTIM